MKTKQGTFEVTPAWMQMLRAPLPTVRVVGRSYPWAGCLIRDTVPTEGRRVWGATPEDEEVFATLHRSAQEN